MKHLVVGGCSFSDGTDDWPTALVNRLENYTLHNTARGSSGNEMISRRVIHKVNDLLKQESADDIIVGIMWSSATRKTFYGCSKYEVNKIFHPYGKITYKKYIKNKQTPDINPEIWPENDNLGLWCNATMGTDFSYYRRYMQDFFSETLSVVQTLEHVLRIQWFLENKSIKYFMVPYMESWVYENNRINAVQIDYLIEMIDYDKWLPVDGEYEWVKENSKSPWRNKHKNDHHPSQSQHEDFVNEVILPWLKDKKYV